MNTNEFFELIETIKKLNDSYHLFKELNEKIKENKDEALIKVLELEYILLKFDIGLGQLNPIYVTVGRDGKKTINSPSIDLLKEEDKVYVENRAESVVNPLLKIRYNQILWKFPNAKKEFKYAEIVVNESLELLNKWLLDDNSAIEFERVLFNVTVIAIDISYRKEDIKSVFKRRLQSLDSDSYWIATHILIFMNEKSNFFKSNDFDNIEVLLKKILQHEKLNSYNNLIGEDFFEISEKIAQKINSDPKFWLNEAGNYAEYYAEKRMEDDESRITVISFLKQAAVNFRKAGNVTKLNDILVKLQNTDVQLSEIKVPLGEKEQEIFETVTDLQVKEFLKFKDNEFYNNLATFRLLIPSVSNIQNAVDSNHVNTFMDFAKSYSYDINGNVSDGDTPQSRRFKMFYDVYINALFHLLWKLFHDGIKSNIISYESLFTYLTEESWIGASYNQKHFKKAEKNWVLLLSPSLFDFFFKFSFYFKSFNDFTLITEIDSLVLKVEGLLRELIQKNGQSTQVLNKTGSGIKEVPLEELLSKQVIKDILGEDETYFIRYILSNTGMNLRNKIAHCYFDIDNYSPIHAIVLIFIIIRISKFQYADTVTH